MIKEKSKIWISAIILGLLILAGSNTLRAQSIEKLTIEECYTLAKSNFPLLRQLSLIDKTGEYSLDNASKGYLPQFSVNGQATYQSQVTSVPVNLPNINIPTVSKDQYKIYSEVNQPITDVITINRQKELIKTGNEIEKQKVEIELYKLRDRVNNLFFGILLINAQIEQSELLKNDIQSGINKIDAAIANGTALKSSVSTLKAELLKANQRTIELKAARKGYIDMLALFIGKKIPEHSVLVKPIPQILQSELNRPELKLYDVQKKYFDDQKKLVDSKNIPRVGLFMQGGYGRPALNMLNNDFELYYIGGLRLNWSLSGFYTNKKEKKILSINQSSIDIQKETFVLNTNIALAQQNNEIGKYTELISTDNEIIALREDIKTTSKSQLEQGTITANDYLVNVNAEDLARQNMALHNLQLLMAEYNYQTTSGN